MSISVVNGYVCFNCTDTEKAQKGVDPANATNDPARNPKDLEKREVASAEARAALERIVGIGRALNVTA
jgi:hypothetical protein